MKSSRGCILTSSVNFLWDKGKLFCVCKQILAVLQDACCSVSFSLIKICMLCFCSRFSLLNLFLLLGIDTFGTLLKLWSLYCLKELHHNYFFSKYMKFQFTVKENTCYILPCLKSMYFSVDFIKLKHRIHNRITVKLPVMVAYVCKAP